METDTLRTDIERGISRGFTLIELLVVMAIIALLMAILLPTLSKCRTISMRVICRSNLRQIYTGWQVYLEDNNQRFYQGVNASHDFGGWKGTASPSLHRPISMALRLDPNSEDNTEVFRCPADSGGMAGAPRRELAYHYYGNSYQTNILLVGQTRLGVPRGVYKALFETINELLGGLTKDAVANPAMVLFYGDNNWGYQWNPFSSNGVDWHGKAEHYNMAFLDGHTDFLRIHKDFFVAPEYRILPFPELDELIPASE